MWKGTNLNNSNRYCILVQGCDRYSFIFKYFLDAIRPHLDGRKIFFATEEVDVDDEIAINIKVKGSWSARLRQVLEHELLRDYEHLIYCQEDMLITHMDFSTINKSYQFLINSGADIVKLGNNREFNTVSTEYKINGYPVASQKEKDYYAISHQPISIFNKSFLLNSLYGDFGPSQHEIEASQKYPAKVFCVGDVYWPNRSDIVTFTHSIQRGKILPEGEELIERIKNEKQSQNTKIGEGGRLSV